MATGKCLCGAVGFEAQGVQTEIHVCHCSMCRRWNGGAGIRRGCCVRAVLRRRKDSSLRFV